MPDVVTKNILSSVSKDEIENNNDDYNNDNYNNNKNINDDANSSFCLLGICCWMCCVGILECFN
jgi:hypothetical protein